MLLTYPSMLANAKVSSHTELNNDFNAISSIVNGALSGDNFSTDAQLIVNSLTASTVYTDSIITSGTLTIKLPSTDGSHSFTVKSYLGADLMKVASDGRVTFYGDACPLPVGTVLMYNGTAIPDADTRSTDLSYLMMLGWYVCNGQTSTPDLRNRFIVGDTVSGATGGSDDAQVPQHTHTYSIGNASVSHTHSYSSLTMGYTDPNHTHTFYSNASGTSANRLLAGALNTSTYMMKPLSTAGGETHTHTISVATTGVSSSHTHTITVGYASTNNGQGKNMPPYYSLIFVKRMS
jgi:hypothetical protein